MRDDHIPEDSTPEIDQALEMKFFPAILFIFFIAMFACQRQPSEVRPRSTNSVSTQESSSTRQQSELAEAREQYDFTSIDKLLQGSVGRIGGGCSLLLIKDQRVVYRRAFGSYAVEKVVPIASASKWLSAAVIMALVDEGKLSLDDAVAKYLPKFDDQKSNITVRQLFAHTSGLPGEAACRNDRRTTLEQCANEVAIMRLRAMPGTEFYYGGVSMHVGGRIAEIASGKSWNDLFVEKIAAPLGMASTDYYAYGQTRNPRPAGDARSTVDDYGRFLLMILNRGEINGRRILSTQAVAEMLKDQTAGVPISYTIYQKHTRLDPQLARARYGLGMWREVTDEQSGKLREASSQGAFGFSPWIDFERRVAGVLLVHSSMSRVMPVYLDLKTEVRRIIPVTVEAY